MVCEEQYTKSGAYWAWKGGGDQLWENYWDNSNRTEAFDNKPSKEGGDMQKAQEMFDMSVEAVGLKASELGPGSFRPGISGGPSLPNPFKAFAGAK